MDDMIKRLNDAANPAQNGGGGGSWEQHKALLTEAAETIARLEAALGAIEQMETACANATVRNMANAARAALSPKTPAKASP